MNCPELSCIVSIIICLIIIYYMAELPTNVLPETPLTIPSIQYYGMHRSAYVPPLNAPFPSVMDLSTFPSLLYPHRSARQRDPNNNAYLPPINIGATQHRIHANNNIPNTAIDNLLRLRPRPGNPREPQQYINTYGTCRSEEQPTFTADFFDWGVYGIEDGVEYVTIFKCSQNKNKVVDVITNLQISVATVKKCSMSARTNTIKSIEDTCTDVTWWQEDKCPCSSSVPEQTDDSIGDIIASSLEEGLNPRNFRLRYPKISSINSNIAWFTNSYDAQQKNKRETEQKEAVVWFDGIINPIQSKVVEIIETAREAYVAEFETDAKRVLMGHRHVYFIVSPDGNRGLTTSGKYLKFKHGETKVICLSGGGKTDDVIYNFHTQLKTATECQFLIWNVPRESTAVFSWACLEQMCDALTSTNKYKCITDMVPPPTPLIITNKMFELRHATTKKPVITLDRIKMYRVMTTSDTIQSVDVYNYYIAKYAEDPRTIPNNRQEIELKDL